MLVFQLCFVLFLYSLFRVFQQYLAPVVVPILTVFSCPMQPVPLSDFSALLPNGHICVIDCDIRINIPELRTGGTRKLINKVEIIK